MCAGQYTGWKGGTCTHQLKFLKRADGLYSRSHCIVLTKIQFKDDSFFLRHFLSFFQNIWFCILEAFVKQRWNTWNFKKGYWEKGYLHFEFTNQVCILAYYVFSRSKLGTSWLFKISTSLIFTKNLQVLSINVIQLF